MAYNSGDDRVQGSKPGRGRGRGRRLMTTRVIADNEVFQSLAKTFAELETAAEEKLTRARELESLENVETGEKSLGIEENEHESKAEQACSVFKIRDLQIPSVPSPTDIELEPRVKTDAIQALRNLCYKLKIWVEYEDVEQQHTLIYVVKCKVGSEMCETRASRISKEDAKRKAASAAYTRLEDLLIMKVEGFAAAMKENPNFNLIDTSYELVAKRDATAESDWRTEDCIADLKCRKGPLIEQLKGSLGCIEGIKFLERLAIEQKFKIDLSEMGSDEDGKTCLAVVSSGKFPILFCLGKAETSILAMEHAALNALQTLHVFLNS